MPAACSQLEAQPGPSLSSSLIPRRHCQATDRYTHLAVAASRMAVEDGGLDLEKVDKRRFGVIVGTAFGGMDTFEKQARAWRVFRTCMCA